MAKVKDVFNNSISFDIGNGKTLGKALQLSINIHSCICWVLECLNPVNAQAAERP
jgi:hypothetical protein